MTAEIHQQRKLEYVLVTPARNEEHYIRKTLESMAAQRRPPLRWVVVSDGSTDGTDELVETYSRTTNWIRLVRLPEKRDRNFAAKVSCFNAGYEEVKELPFDVIGSLDADISFESDYFDFLMSRFEEYPRLGVGGTPFVEHGQHYNYRFTNIEHVSGACQMFRRDCFAEIGGYKPIRGGGIDWVAVTTARMKGWQTRTFTEKTCLHHRPMGTGSGSLLGGIFRHGQKDYYLGGHPLWQVVRAAYQATRTPVIAGGTMLLAGYVWAAVCRRQRPISNELMTFHRREQMARLKAMVVARRA